jgi:hypothetical protein
VLDIIDDVAHALAPLLPGLTNVHTLRLHFWYDDIRIDRLPVTASRLVTHVDLRGLYYDDYQVRLESPPCRRRWRA